MISFSNYTRFYLQEAHDIDRILAEVTLGQEPIRNMGSYLQGMTLGVNDKLFFLNLIQPDFIVDFGSANGYVLSEIHKRKPQIALLGYDISPDMVAQSTKTYPQIPVTSKWNDVITEIPKYKKSCLLLSSVIHEVYSYSDEAGVAQFWKNILSAGFEFIVVRDTIPREDLEHVAEKSFKQDAKVVRTKVTADGNQHLLQDYESRWGAIDSNYKTLVRFILMYRYRENWSRERLEDYLPVSYEQLLNKFMTQYTNKYHIIYDKQFKFKPIQRSFDVDFGVSLRKDLHLKLILRKN